MLDYNNMLSSRLDGRGIDPVRLEAAGGRFREVHGEVDRRRTEGELGFLELPHDEDGVRRTREFADSVRGVDTVVVLGIGGSALGASALFRALAHPFWNELGGAERKGYPRLYVLDNIDPTTIGPLLDRLDPDRTLVNVVSKSGETAETMAQFLVMREWLLDAMDEDACRRHLVFTTDPDKGVLRRVAQDEGIATLSIPPAAGGRFSVLSAVGLLPSALVGLDIDALLAGARSMDRRCRTDVLPENPAGLFATLQYLADAEAHAPIHVMMAYSDRLYGVADWYRQLWAESLGKRLDRDGREVFRGPTPIKALGATDQHSQVQLYVEGPFDKTVTFLTVRERRADVAIPCGYADIEALAYLGGHTLGELMDAERHATAEALAQHGRMNMTLELPALSAHATGELLMLLEIATAYAGTLYGVDPLGQPGVELGKRLTYGLMGRPSYDIPATPAQDPRWIDA